VDRVLELLGEAVVSRKVHRSDVQAVLTNSATSLALPLSDSLWTLDLSFSGATDAILVVICPEFQNAVGKGVARRGC
jgi:hypothetical protein